MKHLGQILKNHVEANHLKKRDVADAVGITYNYLSTVFTKKSIDCELWEKLCNASGLNPSVIFETPYELDNTTLDNATQATENGSHKPKTSDRETLLELLAEKERLIQVLLATSGIKVATKTEQH